MLRDEDAQRETGPQTDLARIRSSREEAGK